MNVSIYEGLRERKKRELYSRGNENPIEGGKKMKRTNEHRMIETSNEH